MLPPIFLPPTKPRRFCCTLSPWHKEDDLHPHLLLMVRAPAQGTWIGGGDPGQQASSRTRCPSLSLRQSLYLIQSHCTHWAFSATGLVLGLPWMSVWNVNSSCSGTSVWVECLLDVMVLSHSCCWGNSFSVDVYLLLDGGDREALHISLVLESLWVMTEMQ